MKARGSRLADVLRSVGQRVASAASEGTRVGGTLNSVGRANIVIAKNVRKSGSVNIETSSDVSSISQGTIRGPRRPNHPMES